MRTFFTNIVILKLIFSKADVLPDEACDASGNAKEGSSNDNKGKSVAVCGEWCSNMESFDVDTPCRIDETLIPCRGEFCTTTCYEWKKSVLMDLQSFNFTCWEYMSGRVFPKGGKVCHPECLVPEIRPNRYPVPTGLGLFCRPDSCDPAIQSRWANDEESKYEGLGVLSCPCNWFGSDCRDDWIPIKAMEKEELGEIQITKFWIDENLWHSIMENHRPGGVVRVNFIDEYGTVFEQPYALANDKDGDIGSLEILAGPPPKSMHPHVTWLGYHIRSLPNGASTRGLFVNPSVTGFFNSHYVFLMDALHQFEKLENIVLLSTGVGLSGIRSALNRLLPFAKQIPPAKLHLYYGVRDAQHIPWKQHFRVWSDNSVRITILVSSTGKLSRKVENNGDDIEVLKSAIQRGDNLKTSAMLEETSLTPLIRSLGKVYAQHALGFEFLDEDQTGLTLDNTIVIICGRVELLLETPDILKTVCSQESCDNLIAERIFTNI